jgi:hypothetical protein
MADEMPGKRTAEVLDWVLLCLKLAMERKACPSRTETLLLQTTAIIFCSEINGVLK